MLNVSKPSANRLDIELSGTLDADAMSSALDQLIEESEDITKGRMLYRITDFEMPTMGALGVELQKMPKLLGLIGKFEKCAVLSDDAWIRTAAEIEGAVIPFLEIKGFPLSAANLAEEWLEGSLKGGNSDEEAENFPV
jgi:hypothetical protein